ncbi:MAG: helix-hairpin-helix domain-containing protein [Myxococcota bacterium]
MEDRGRAALWLVVLLFLFALPDESPVPAPCPRPAEFAGEGGVTRHVVCGGGGRGSLRGPARLLYGQPLDLNRTPASSLEALPGVGPGLAQKIVAARPFASVGALRGVGGIGPRRFSRVADLLYVDRLSGPRTDSLSGRGAGDSEDRR